MQWNQIKNIFILVFLLLNIYLFYQFNDKREQSDVPILEPQESSIEHQLDVEDIEIAADLPDGDLKESYISVNQRSFSKDEFDELEAIKNQKMMIINKTFLVSLFEKPLPLQKDDTGKDIKKVLEDKVLFPDEYEFWGWNKETNVVMFFQKTNDHSVYFNQNGVILLYLNDDNEVVLYTQTMLDETKNVQEPKTLIEPMIAIETLYNTNELTSGDKITDVNIGFHTRVPLEDGEQIFAPTWKVVVNDERNYFVNAIEGFVFAGDEEQFLHESISLYIDRMKDIDKEQEVMKKFMIELLKGKLDNITEGE